MLNKENNILKDRNIPPELVCGNNAIQLDNVQFINEVLDGIVNGVSQLPIHPGFEKHPYKGILENIDAPKYIIGTFPPISYLIDVLKQNNPCIILNTLSQPTLPNQIITAPSIPFFHGNISALWSVLLTKDELTLLNSQLAISRQAAKTWLIKFLTNKGIYYDDIILSTQRELGKLGKPHKNLGYTYEDKNLKNICIDQTLIIKLIKSATTKLICFTNGATFSTKGLEFYKTRNRNGQVNTRNADAFSLFLRGCQDLGLDIEMQCLPCFTWAPINSLTLTQKRTKLIFELRISKERSCNHPELKYFQTSTFTVITPFSPSAHGKIETNAVIKKYRIIKGQVSIKNILSDVYSKFRNNQSAQLNQYNV